MIIVNKSQVHLSGGILCTEASTIGLRPGEWPDFISVLDDKGEGFIFQRGRADADGAGGELHGYHYQSRTSSIELLVIND